MEQNPTMPSARLVLIGLLSITPHVALGQAQAGANGTAQAEPQQEKPATTTTFIFVEGSLPFVPSSNTIATKLPLELRLTPSNVGVVTSALFKEQYGQVVGDALRNVSGVNVQPGFGVTDFFIVRGFDSLNGGLVLTDGASEPEASFYQLYNVAAVEVLKGPGGFLYGSNPLAGAVNLVRKQPMRAQRQFDVGAAFGSFSHVEGHFDINYGSPTGAVDFRLNSLWRSSDRYRDAKQDEAVAVNPALTWHIDEASSLNLNFELAQSDFSPEAGVPLLFGALPDIDRQQNYNSRFDRSEQDVLRFQADYERRVSDSFTLRNKLYYRRLDWLSDGTLINGAFPSFDIEGNPIAGFSVSRSLILLNDDQRFFGNQLEGVFSFETGGLRHNLLTGVELARFADQFTLDIGFLQDVDLFQPVDGTQGIFVLPQFSSAGDARSIVFAPYAIDQITVSDSFQLLAGARLDAIDFKEDLSGASRDDTELSPMLGAVYAPTSDLSLYGNFSRSFAPPSPRAFGAFAPEKSQQFELGVKIRFLDGRARATAAVFNLERDNIAIPDDNGFTQQLGNQRSRGLELEMAAELGDGLRGVASYAYTDAELTEFAEQLFVPTEFGIIPITFDRSGNRPAFAPEHIFNSWLSKSFLNGIGAGVGLRYLSSQFIAEDNSFEIGDVLTVSAALSYEIDDFVLSLNAANLTDRETLWRAFGSQAVTPADPATVFVRVDYRFR